MLVVEDETILRKGICRVGDWEAHEVEICGAAANGKEALKEIQKCKPDIILTDVVMPVMDGIELAKQVHGQYPDIRMIFLSGHEEFEYVKKAMEYKASSYLLKPAKIEKIVEVVSEIRDEILRDRARQQEEERLQKKLEQSIPILREHYMNKLLNGIECDEEKIRRQFEFLNIDLKNENLAVMLCDPDTEAEERGASEIFLLQLNEVCEEIISREYRSAVFTDLKDRIVILLNYPENMKAKDVLLYLQGKAMRIQKEMENCWGLSVSLGIGRVAKNISGLAKAYKEAEYALSYRFFMGNKSIIYIGDIEKEEHYDWFQMEQQEGELLSCIKAGDVIGTGQQLEKYFALLSEYAVCGHAFIYDEILVFINNLLRFLRGKVMEGEKNFLSRLEELLEDLRKKHTYTTLSELQKQVTAVIMGITETIDQNRMLRNEGIIEKAKKYVQQNLSGDVSLITVAEMVYVSPNYLSCLFKESGENFKDCVIRLKMEKAAEMMATEKYNLNQIALALGYKDGRYFSQVYKKYKEQQI